MPLAPATGEPHSRRGKHGVRATGSSPAGHAPDYPADHQTSNERSSGSNWKNEGEESVKEKGAYSSRHLDYDTFPPLQQKPVNSGYKETSEWVDWQHAAGGSSTEAYSWDSSWTSGRWSNRRSAEQDTQKYKEEEQVEAEPAYEPLPSRENDNKEYFPRRWSPSVPAAAAVAVSVPAEEQEQPKGGGSLGSEQRLPSKAAAAAAEVSFDEFMAREQGACEASVVEICEATGPEAMKSVHEYVQNQRLDSFALSAFQQTPGCFYSIPDVKADKGVVRMQLNLPAACPHRFHFEVDMASPEVGGSEEKAKQLLAAQAVKKLTAKGLLGPTAAKKAQSSEKPASEGPNGDAPQFPLDGSGEEKQKEAQIPLSAGPSQVQLYLVDTGDDSVSLGLVTTGQANFSYQLKLDGLEVRLEAVSDEWTVDLSDLELVRQFHSKVISSELEQNFEMALVQVLDRRIDIEGMREFLSGENHLPPMPWMPELIQKVKRLSWWEVVRKFAPTEPTPSPLKLHLIFDCDDEDSAAARKALAATGRGNLELIAAVSFSTAQPHVSADELRGKIEEFLEERQVADLLFRSGLPVFGIRKAVSQEDAVEMFYALVGTHKLESDHFAIIRLWKWLSNEDSLQSANGHTAGCPRFLGRTPSYMEFGEVEPPVGEKHTAPHLKVRYEEYDDAHYRWNESTAEEKRPEISDCDWQPLVWDPINSTFCSPSMKLPDGRNRPLPNKVCAWLRGRSITKLVSIKHSMESTPPYKSLREEHVPQSSLVVDYQDHGVMKYCRSKTGGLGVEIVVLGDQELPDLLGYSESKKTLLSQAMSGRALPRKVVTWLLENRCLADLIPGRKKTTSDVDISKEGEASWKSEKTGHEYKCRAMAVQHGVVYESQTDGDGKWQVLTYSEVCKEWTVTGSGGADASQPEVVPCEAISHVSTESARLPAGTDSSEIGVLRLNTPGSVRLLFPQLSGTDLAEVEQQMDHRFKNPRLLAEALTHCSALKSATASCEHLAYVGRAAVHAFVSERIVVTKASFFTGTTVVKEGIPIMDVFSAPAGWNQWATTKRTKAVEWLAPAAPSVGANLDSWESMDSKMAACCNHSSYAYSCVKLGLHRAVHHSVGSELEETIRKFARRYSPERDTEGQLWHQLWKQGAPKVLGDVFLACVGAIVMDSDYTEADSILTQHYNDCSAQLAPVMPAKVKVLRPEDVTQEMFAKVSMESKGVLSPWVTSLEARNSGDEPGASEDLRLALSCTDVKLREVGDDGTLCLGSSPRAIELGAALDSVFPEGAESIESSDDGGSSYLEEDGDGSKKAQARVAALAKEQPECEGAIYCRHCEMWLNGPTQWADHEIGKKHRKAVRRTQVQKQLGADGEEKEIKAVPEGFGKKMKSIDAIFRSRQAEGDEKSEAGGQGDERPQASESLPFQGRTRGNLAGFRKSGGQVPPPPPPPEGMRDEHGNWRSEGDQLRWRAEYSQGSHQGQWPAAAQPVWGCNYNPETGQWAYGMMIPAGNLPPPPVFQDQWYGYSQEQQHQ